MAPADAALAAARKERRERRLDVELLITSFSSFTNFVREQNREEDNTRFG
jgi:hypothetical protein